MRIFITGASGFVGGAIARALVKDRHGVFAMARSARSIEKVRATGATAVECDLGTVTADDLAGCEIIIHNAARAEAWGRLSDFERINVDGTTRLLEAAREAGVRRFIHMSTEAVLFHGQHLRDVDETHPYADHGPIYYGRTKAEAERRVRAANGEDFTTICLRPRFVWGPGDQTVLTNIGRAAIDGRWQWFDGGRAVTSTCHIDNLVHATKLAMEAGQGGEAYFITDDEDVSFRDFLPRYLGTQGVTFPDRAIPSWLILPIVRVLDMVWTMVLPGKEPPLPYHGIAVMARDCTLRIDKAKRELGYAPVVTIDEGLASMPDEHLDL